MSEQQVRERALERAMARARVDLGIKRDYELAERLGLSDQQVVRRKKDFYRGLGFADAVSTAERLGFTADEVLEIFGLKERRAV